MTIQPVSINQGTDTKYPDCLQLVFPYSTVAVPCSLETLRQSTCSLQIVNPIGISERLWLRMDRGEDVPVLSLQMGMTLYSGYADLQS